MGILLLSAPADGAAVLIVCIVIFSGENLLRIMSCTIQVERPLFLVMKDMLPVIDGCLVKN